MFYHLPLPVISEALPGYRVSLLSESPTFHRFHTDLRPEFAQGFASPWFNRTLFNATRFLTYVPNIYIYIFFRKKISNLIGIRQIYFYINYTLLLLFSPFYLFIF